MIKEMLCPCGVKINTDSDKVFICPICQNTNHEETFRLQWDNRKKQNIIFDQSKAQKKTKK